MKDLHEAIERLSAMISFRVDSLAKQRSFAVSFSGYTVSPDPKTPLRLFHTMVHLPQGYAASFTPRQQAESDDAWHIDIRRSDGTLRQSWAGGITIGRLAGQMALLYDGQALTDQHLSRILADLERPGLAGMMLEIARTYTARFGRMPTEIAARLESVRDVDLLDRIFEAVQAGAEQEAIAAMLRPAGAPVVAAPVAAAPAEAERAEPTPPASSAAPATASDEPHGSGQTPASSL